MAVTEQTPFIKYTANGSTTVFPLTFDCKNSDYLVVKINDVLQLAGTWALIDGGVVFNIAPIAGSLVSIQRITPLKRTTSYQTYDNSFRPEPVDIDFDDIWYVLQEFAIQNSLTQEKFQELIDQLVEGNINGLPSEILARIAGDEANTLLINQEALRAYSAEQNLAFLIEQEEVRATGVEQDIQNQVNALGGGTYGFATYAAFDAVKATIPINSIVHIDEVNTGSGTWGQGLNTWDGTTLKKSPYDPLQLSKDYTDDQLPIVTIGNLYNPATNAANINVNPADGSLRTTSFPADRVNVFPVVAGTKYTIYAASFNSNIAVAVSPNNSTTPPKAQTLITLQATEDPNKKTFVSPITGYGFINVIWTNASLDISTTLNISTLNEQGVTEVAGVQVVDSVARAKVKAIEDIGPLGETDLGVVYPEIYGISAKTAGFFVGTSGTIVSNSGGELVCFEIKPNHTYLLKAPQFLTTKTVGLSATNTVTNGKAITNRALAATTDPTIYKFSTTDSDASFLYAFFTTRLDSQTYDVRSSLKIYVDEIPEDETPYIEKIQGIRLKSETDTPPVVITTRLTGKKCFAFGDSITAGTGGSIVAWWEEIWGTTVNNYGSSGGRASRVVDIAVAGEGLAKRDSATSGTVWPTKDYSNLACVNLMIGTNDSDGTSFGNIADNPTGRVEDYPTTNDYWNLFPNTYVGNISLFIEFIRWKAPQAEIHITTPPYRNQATPYNPPERITQLIPYLESIAHIYGVHLIYGTYECGIGYKHMHPASLDYSTDGVHFTALGNEIFGKFVAYKTLSFG